jgi:hypothetical protein
LPIPERKIPFGNFFGAENDFQGKTAEKLQKNGFFSKLGLQNFKSGVY